MSTIVGRGVSPGIGLGPVVTVTPVRTDLSAAESLREESLREESREEAIRRFDEAVADTAADLDARIAASSGESRDILIATRALAADRSLRERVTGLIEDGRSPEAAVREASAAIATVFAGHGDVFAARIRDIDDIRDRLLSALLGDAQPGVPTLSEPSVLVAHDLSPADTATLDPSMVVGLVTAAGGPTSHTAILARSLGIPAVVAAPEASDLVAGTVVLVDGTHGTIVVAPGDDEIAAARHADDAPRTVGGTQTRDGTPVELLGNVGDETGARQVADCDADGIGLFRTEFSFLNRTTRPEVADQVAVYASVLGAVPGRKVVVRTLDAGADKPMPFLAAADEANPALGVRGYRATADLLADQLEAIVSAARAHGTDPWVMAPMVSTPAEARDFAELARRHGVGHVGVMVEVPSAAVMAEEILAECDFVSIGTNDLTQYTMAADRELGALADFNDPWQPAVLRLVQRVAEAGLAQAKPVGVCGEAAADPVLACVLVGMGVSSLSASPRALPAVAAELAGVDLAVCQEAAGAAVTASSAAAARTEATRIVHESESRGE